MFKSQWHKEMHLPVLLVGGASLGQTKTVTVTFPASAGTSGSRVAPQRLQEAQKRRLGDIPRQMRHRYTKAMTGKSLLAAVIARFVQWYNQYRYHGGPGGKDGGKKVILADKQWLKIGPISFIASRRS